MKLHHIEVSQTGLRRDNNEDAVAWIEAPKSWTHQAMGALAVVSDGMGGYSRGERASALVIENLKRHYFQSIQSPLKALNMAGIHANRAVYAEASQHQQKMGATCTAVAILPDQCHILHIGDSRCYSTHQGQLRLLTNDHTALAELHKSPWALDTPSTLMISPHALTKAMGIKDQEKFDGDLFSIPNDYNNGDRMLLCTDGITLHMTDSQLADLLLSPKKLREISNNIVRHILHEGAKDNFSFILIEFQS